MTSSRPNSPRRQPRHRLHASQDSGIPKTRAVPYSSHRLSSEGSAAPSFRPVSYSARPAAPSAHPDELEQGLGLGLSGEEPSLPKEKATVSGSRRHSRFNSVSSSSANEPYCLDNDNRSISSRASSPRPLGAHGRVKRTRAISINSDKTFSLVPQQSGSVTSRDSRSYSLSTPYLSSTTPSSSYGRVSSNIFVREDRANSPLTPLAERRFRSYSASSTLPDVASSPSCNWRSRGGMHSVEETPVPEDEQSDDVTPEPRKDMTESLQEEPPTQDIDNSELSYKVSWQASDLATKESWQTSDLNTKESWQTSDLRTKESFLTNATSASVAASTISERTNYKVYEQSSPVRPLSRYQSFDFQDSIPPSSSHANYQILGETSSSNQSEDEQSNYARPPTEDSNVNYVVHAASCSSLGTSQQLKCEYSQESLVVPPLRPVKRSSSEQVSPSESRSREQLRSGSLSSMANILVHGAARTIFTGSKSSKRHRSWGASSSTEPSKADSKGKGKRPHHWSAPLSTVASESEPGSGPPSRSLSPTSQWDRKSSGFNSISSALALTPSWGGDIEAHQMSKPDANDIVEWPAAVYGSNPAYRDPSGRLIRDYDEDGDGLADLEDDMMPRHRSRLSSFISNGSDRVLRPSNSTRSLNLSLPSWVSVYYSSVDRRFLLAQPSTDSIRSLYNGSLYNDSRAPSFRGPNQRLDKSPSLEGFNTSIYNPRRRPMENATICSIEQTPEPLSRPGSQSRPPTRPDAPTPSRSRPQRMLHSAAGSQSIRSHPVMRVARGIKKQTSSIWSPHLRRDRRIDGFSMWDPPSAVWSNESGFDWKRNQQIVMFVAGFLLPFCKC